MSELKVSMFDVRSGEMFAGRASSVLKKEGTNKYLYYCNLPSAVMQALAASGITTLRQKITVGFLSTTDEHAITIFDAIHTEAMNTLTRALSSRLDTDISKWSGRRVMYNIAAWQKAHLPASVVIEALGTEPTLPGTVTTPAVETPAVPVVRSAKKPDSQKFKSDDAEYMGLVMTVQNLSAEVIRLRGALTTK